MLEKLKNIGPGAMVAAAFIGPGTVTTATIAGSSYGYTLLWAILFSTFATLILQEMAARLGIIGGMGIGDAIRQKISHPILKLAASLLVIGAILVGNAAYEAGNISGAVLGFPQFAGGLINPLIIIIGVLAFLLLFSGKYKLIERSLVVLVSIMGIVFFVAALLLQPSWSGILQGLFMPSAPDGALLLIVGLIGTTVVPYNLFLHASSVRQRWSGEADLALSRWDTALSVILGGIITMAILITAAVAFQGQEKSVNSAADLAIQLQPLLGDWAQTFIALGFLAAGLSSSITAPLAAAYATSEIMGWERDLTNQKFRIVWIFVLLIGVLFSSLGFKPTAVIVFAQFANGLLLPIIAGFLLWIMNDKQLLGKYANSLIINILGLVVVSITIGLGLRSILKVFGFL